jgi:hypothetical protein
MHKDLKPYTPEGHEPTIFFFYEAFPQTECQIEP